MPSVEQVTTDVANLAIAHCGISKPIASLNADKSLEGQMCRTFFDIARQETLREFPWTFASKQINPALVASQPTPEYMFAYQYPADALRIIRFMSWRLSNDTRQSRIEYRIMQPVSEALSTLAAPPTYTQTTGLWIYTNWPGVNTSLPTIIEYLFDNTNVAQWPPDFILALSWKLATYILTTISTANPQQLAQVVENGYMNAINKAKAFSLNEDQRPEEPQSEFIRAREGDMFGYTGMTWVAEPAGFSVQ